MTNTQIRTKLQLLQKFRICIPRQKYSIQGTEWRLFVFSLIFLIAVSTEPVKSPHGAQVTVGDTKATLCLSVNGKPPAVLAGRSRALLPAICQSAITSWEGQREKRKRQIEIGERRRIWKEMEKRWWRTGIQIQSRKNHREKRRGNDKDFDEPRTWNTPQLSLASLRTTTHHLVIFPTLCIKPQPLRPTPCLSHVTVSHQWGVATWALYVKSHAEPLLT